MDANPTIARPAYFLAILLFVLPLADAATSVWPFHLGLEQWRFGATGVLSNDTLLPLAGVFLAMVTARTNDHRVTRRILGWMCALFAVLLLGLLLLFVLDYFQARSAARLEYRHPMQIAMAIATVKMVLTILAFTMLAPAGVMAPKGGRKEFPDPDKAVTPLIPVMGAPRTE